MDAGRGGPPRRASASHEPDGSPKQTTEPVAPARLPSQRGLSFAVIGDFGTGGDEQREVAGRMCRWRSNHPFDLVVTTGDNVYPDGHPSRFEDVFFRPYSCLLKNGVSFRASLGNHDVVTENGRPELEEPAFGLPQRNHVVRRRGVRFVLASSSNLNREWLRRATREETGDRWTIVVFHHPVYSAGTTHGSTEGFRPGLPYLFRRRGVDLVLNGHDHVYTVTKSLKGIRYVVTGGGGAGLYGCGERWFTAVCVERHHFLYVSAKADELVVRAVPSRGPYFHRFVTEGIAPQV